MRLKKILKRIIWKKRAFTLAEVLITLGIIGVVAAMTIPALQTNIRRKTASARLKTFYANMKQMLLLAEDDYGSSANWNTRLSKAEFWDTYFLPYLKATKSNDGSKIYFPDGSTLENFGHGSCLELKYDYNGDGGPNKWGYDAYWFVICPTTNGGSGWCPEGFCSRRLDADKNNRSKLLSDCRSNPYTCGGLLEYDHWKFLSDYPYK